MLISYVKDAGSKGNLQECFWAVRPRKRASYLVNMLPKRMVTFADVAMCLVVSGRRACLQDHVIWKLFAPKE
ncbi:unnamed protein product [Ectocarpus sp. 13 AM-2016]